MSDRVVPRVGVLWCPHWSVVVAGAAPNEAVMVLHANRVVAHSAAAGEDGVAVGQRRREAQARCPLVRIAQYDAARDARAFERVVQAVAAIVPRVEVTEPGTLTFLARGPSRYFGGDGPMAATVTRIANEAAGLDAAGLAAGSSFGLGIADGRFAAGVAARRSARLGESLAVHYMVIAAGHKAVADFLAPLPVRLLTVVAGVPAEFVQLLGRLGVHHLGSLAALPVVDVAARFGPLGTFTHRIASGGDDRLPGTHDLPAGLAVQRIFEQPVHHSDVLVFVARQLAQELVDQLAGDGRVCTRLIVAAETEHGEKSERAWYRSNGLSAAAMVERVRWQLEAWAQHETLTAGVTLLRLDPVEVRSDGGVQLGLWGGRTQADEWAVRAVARIVAVAGEQQVLVPATQGGRHPHELFTWVSAVTTDLLEPTERLAANSAPWPGRLPTPSPAIVHASPQTINVTDASGCAVRVTGRGFVSAPPSTVGNEAVQAWAGPWPIEERWWDLTRSRRMARMQVLTHSGRLLLLSVERGQWWLTAEYA